jgi:hypothetical protein
VYDPVTADVPKSRSLPKTFRTEDCKHWLAGLCQHGESCTYRHDMVKPSAGAGAGAGAAPLIETKQATATTTSSSAPAMVYDKAQPLVKVGDSTLVDPGQAFVPYRGQCLLCARKYNSRSQEQAHVQGRLHRNRAALAELNALVQSTPWIPGACYNCHSPQHQRIRCQWFCRAFANGLGCKFGRLCRLTHIVMECR